MDDPYLDRDNFAGILITLEFGPKGRINQIWVADPNLPDEGHEYAFVLPPVAFGEEYSEVYNPGTVLLGARSGADEPWILDRNKNAQSLEVEDTGRTMRFEYEFPLLPELRVTGRFYEEATPCPQIVWELRLANRSRRSIELGELAFPMAFNNLYEDNFEADDRDRNIVDDRVRVHSFIGGAASYLFAQRLSGDPPGLLVFPGEGTAWEFSCSVPASLSTPFRWPGIPVVYVLSRAAFEREGWGAGPLAGSTWILEPGDSRTVETRFVSTGAAQVEGLHQALVACGRPTMRLLPGAVAPKTVGIAIEVAGTTPTNFGAPLGTEIETDADENGGFCFVRPKEQGPCEIGFTDRARRHSDVQLFFTEPIEDLIKRRADWIVANQVHRESGSILDKAILPADWRSKQRIMDLDLFGTPLPIETGMCDALFLAEKNALYPDESQINVLDEYIEEFLKDDVQNPGDGSIGCSLVDLKGVAVHYGRRQAYVFGFNLYHAMYRVAATAGGTRREARAYLEDAARTALAMFRNSLRHSAAPGVRGISFLDDLIQDLDVEGMTGLARRLDDLATTRAEDIGAFAMQPATKWAWDTRTFEELAWAARRLRQGELLERAVKMAMSARSLAPDWWSYGSDPRIVVPSDPSDLAAFKDNAEVRLGYTTVANSLLMLEALESDYDTLPEQLVRQAFAGLLGSWALVAPDGGASLGYCADAASKQHGFHPYSGDVGFGLYAYLRRVASWVFPSRSVGTFAFGCHFESEPDKYVLRPWDGVGRRVAVRLVGFEADISFGCFRELEFDVRKRWATFRIENPSNSEVRCELAVRGLWGRSFEVDGKAVSTVEGVLKTCVRLKPKGMTEVSLRAVDS